MIAKPEKDHTIPTLYRPVSLLSCLSKLLEKCVLTRINTYPRIQEGIPSHQFGFREKQGTTEFVTRRCHAHHKTPKSVVPTIFMLDKKFQLKFLISVD